MASRASLPTSKRASARTRSAGALLAAIACCVPFGCGRLEQGDPGLLDESRDAGALPGDGAAPALVDAADPQDQVGFDAASESPVACDEASYVPDASCGVGHCRSTNTPSSCVGGWVVPCAPGVARAAFDDVVTGAEVDDDCDGEVDEDEACDIRPRAFGPGAHVLAVPLNCARLDVRLWGGGGGSGESEGSPPQPGGRGGPGGYAEGTFTLDQRTLTLIVGGGAAPGCGAPGSSALPPFAGGEGGGLAGSDGADGAQTGGGHGARPNRASAGGDGYRGGGGGGAGDPLLGLEGRGGGGGAASVLLIGDVPVVIAGGGGGGGGASTLRVFTVPGGAGGSGCGGDGAEAHPSGGGGGGGGGCLGALIRSGNLATPYDHWSLPQNAARGGTTSCAAGGDGHAIIVFGS